MLCGWVHHSEHFTNPAKGSRKTGWIILRLWTRTSATHFCRIAFRCGGGQLCLTAADCPSGETCTVTGGSYRLHYTISRRL